MATAADGLGAALQRPAVALVVAALLLLVVAWAFQRLWLMLLAWWPGPVRVHDIVLSVDAAECDAAALTTHLRHRLGNLRIRSPATAPGATPERSFGWRRAEVLAALANAVVLVVLGGWIVWAAIGRFSDPPGVTGGWVLAAGVAGLFVNLAAARVLHGAGSGLNVRAAMLHVLADLASSAGVVLAGIVGVAFAAGYILGKLLL